MTNRLALLSCRPFLNILKYRDQRWALPIIWKTRLLQTHIDEFSYMYERSGSQLRATTGIKSGTDAFGKSRFVVTFWAILGVTEMCFAVMQFHISSRRENRWRDTWVDKIRVPREVFGKQFSFIRCRGQHLQAVEQRRYGRFTFVENTISNSPKAPRAKFPDSFLLLAYASLKASRILLQQLAAYLNFNLDSEVLFCWCKPNKWFLWTCQQHKQLKSMEMSEAWFDTYDERFLTWNHSQKSLVAVEAPNFKISSHGTSLKWSQRPSQSALE